jgi:hypothetical protein
MANFVDPQVVRDYLQVTGVTGQWSNGLIGSNVAAASNNLQRWTNRQFEPQGSNTAVTKVFSTDGASRVTIPDLRSATAVTLNDATLTADETYYFIRDRNNSGVFVGIEFPGQRNTWSRGLNTFDINYNHLRYQGYRYETLPNNLSITGVWGHFPYPPELLHATTVLAGYYTLRPDALLGGAVNRLEQGVIFDLSRLPIEVQNFVEAWRIETPAVVAL